VYFVYCVLLYFVYCVLLYFVYCVLQYFVYCVLLYFVYCVLLYFLYFCTSLPLILTSFTCVRIFSLVWLKMIGYFINAWKWIFMV